MSYTNPTEAVKKIMDHGMDAGLVDLYNGAVAIPGFRKKLAESDEITAYRIFTIFDDKAGLELLATAEGISPETARDARDYLDSLRGEKLAPDRSRNLYEDTIDNSLLGPGNRTAKSNKARVMRKNFLP